MTSTFHQRKRKDLSSWPPEGIDAGVLYPCEAVNGWRGVYTVQSCEGHENEDFSNTVDPFAPTLGFLGLHLHKRLRSHAHQLAHHVNSVPGVERCAMLYGRDRYPVFQIIFAPGMASEVGDAVILWLSKSGMGREAEPLAVVAEDDHPSTPDADATKKRLVIDAWGWTATTNDAHPSTPDAEGMHMLGAGVREKGTRRPDGSIRKGDEGP
jgi:hypothetical protein